MKKLYCVICSKYRRSGKPKISDLSLFAVSVKMKMKKIFKAEKSIEILKSSWLN